MTRLEIILVFPVAAGIYVNAVLDPFADGEGGRQPALVQSGEVCFCLRFEAQKPAGQTSTSPSTALQIPLTSPPGSPLAVNVQVWG